MNKKLFLSIILPIWIVNCSICFGQTYEDYINESFDWLEKDSLERAEESLKMALRTEPGNVQNGMLLLNMGTIQRRQGKLKEAEDSYTIGLGFLPRNLSLLNSRAQLYSELEEFEKAIEDYTEIIFQEPENEGALYDRALCRLMNADTLGARLDLQAIDKFNPNSAKSRLGMAYVYKTQFQWREAEELLDALIQRNPKNASLYRERAEVHYLAGRLGAAQDDITKSIEYGPKDPYSYLLRAQIRYAKGDKEYARRDLNHAIDLGMKSEEAKELIEKLK